MENLIKELLGCGVFRLGNFKIKCGAFSPVYIDLRTIISYPSVLNALVSAVRSKQVEEKIEADRVCGVPYTALPVASVFSCLYNMPMVMKRKEAKDYGTKKMVEGNFNAGDTCLIIEDIISSGTSIIETAESLKKVGLTVKDCIVIVNRNQGGLENVKKMGIKIHQLFDMDSIFSAYCSLNKVEDAVIEQVNTYFRENQYLPVFKGNSECNLSYAQRAADSTHPLAKKLFQIMEEKQSNLCVAVDSNHSTELLSIANQLGPHICILKTHIDILNDFSEDVISKLSELSTQHNFLIFEDRKFADIGNTVLQQYKNGIYKIEKWAHLVTVHGIPGDGIINALKSTRCLESRACILIAEMSSEGALTSDEYKGNIFKMAENHPDFVIGYVAQERSVKAHNLIHMCPGVNIMTSGDAFGQQYKTPEDAVTNGADIIIVGRGICKIPDIVSSAIEYKTRAFDAYLKRISQ